jgi:hypothetical protein
MLCNIAALLLFVMLPSVLSQQQLSLTRSPLSQGDETRNNGEIHHKNTSNQQDTSADGIEPLLTWTVNLYQHHPQHFIKSQHPKTGL